MSVVQVSSTSTSTNNIQSRVVCTTIPPTHSTVTTLHHALSTVLISLLFFSCFFSFPSIADFFDIDGFFDAGMLRQALNANRNNEAAVEPAVDREVVRRNVGRRLRLSEY